MEIHISPDVQAKLDQMARDSGCPSAQLVEDALLGYFDELANTREMLDSRYDDLESGRVEPIDGEEFFESLRLREEEMKKPTPQ
jgi:predicted transcriptional regulator